MMLVGPGGSCPQAAEVRKWIFARMWWCAPTPLDGGEGSMQIYGQC